ncbi:hypothetical protein CZ771_00955 [Actinomycetales bacterium JB111]|nr:hypothetical protein CZ771_00955 [Actinomycetales bacterium JB111]
MSVPNQPRGAAALTIPTGVELGSYTKYEDAQRAVDHLSDNDFPVRKVSIVGEDLRMVERITGRLDYGRVAASGAATGAWFGVMMAIVMWIVVGGFGLVDFLVPVVVGAAFGVLLGVGSYTLRPKTRDFTSSSTVVARRYTVIADPSVAAGMQAALAKEGLGGAVRAPVALAGGAYGAPAGGSYGSGAGGYAGGVHGGGATSGGGPGGDVPGGGVSGGDVPAEDVPAEDVPAGGGRTGGGLSAEPGAGAGGFPVDGGPSSSTQAGPGPDGAAGAAGGQRAPSTGFAPGADGTPRYGARLEDLAPDQRAHGEDQLRRAETHRQRPTEPQGEQRAAEG